MSLKQVMMFVRLKYFRKGLLVSLAAILTLNVPNANSQESAIAFAEKELSSLASKITDFRNKRSELDLLAKSLADDINELKKVESLSYFQRQRLNRLLKESQDVANAIESIDAELRKLHKRFTRLGARLVELYDAEIEQHLKELENKDLKGEDRKLLIREIEALRSQKEDVQKQKKTQDAPELKLAPLEIEADDSPRQIEQKADLLKDQEEKLRHLADELAKQRSEAKQELTIRNRMSDFITDMALFDQQEEALSTLSEATQDAAVTSVAQEETRDLTDQGVSRTGLDAAFLVAQKDFDFTDLSPEQLEQTIEILQKQQERVKAQADSLSQQANRFYKTAQDLKKQ